MSFLLYEIKKKKHIFAVSLIVILSILISYLIRVRFPSAVISAAGYINENDWLKVLIGLDGNIEKLTMQDILVAIFSFWRPIMLCAIFISAVYIVVKDERMGVSLFFRVQTGKKAKTIIIKLLIDFLLWTIFVGVIWMLLWKLSLKGVEDIEFFRVVIKEDIFKLMKRFAAVAFVMWSAGFFYGVIKKNNVSVFKFIYEFFVINLLVTVPMWLNSLTSVYELSSRINELLGNLSNILMKVYRVIPNFWCTEVGNIISTNWVCSASILIGSLFLLSGLVINIRRKK